MGVDADSTDATESIAKRFVNRYVVEAWHGCTGKKRFGADRCRNEWVLVLDGGKGPVLEN